MQIQIAYNIDRKKPEINSNKIHLGTSFSQGDIYSIKKIDKITDNSLRFSYFDRDNDLVFKFTISEVVLIVTEFEYEILKTLIDPSEIRDKITVLYGHKCYGETKSPPQD
ncbi:hypothetical protein H6G36_01815 [Anabaena minutissima FACHB-250]|nr:hypothetical protein [Anabaena minutissima FACHB-250]